MKKEELQKLLKEETRTSLTIDAYRRLMYENCADDEDIDIKENGKRDVLLLIFKNEYGAVLDYYQIISRNPADILEEIKTCTKDYFNELAEFLNSTKILANNWK